MTDVDLNPRRVIGIVLYEVNQIRHRLQQAIQLSIRCNKRLGFHAAANLPIRFGMNVLSNPLLLLVVC